MEKLNPCAANSEPVLESWGATAPEAPVPRALALCTATEAQPLLAATREKPAQQRRASTAESKFQKKKFLKKMCKVR